MTDTTIPAQTDTVVLAKFFGLKGQQAITELKALTPQDKAELAAGIRDGSFTY